MIALALILRGSFVAPALIGVEIRLREKYGHVALLLSDGRIIEASALHNEVLLHDHPCEWWNYEEVLPLNHLGLAAQMDIARIALAMRYWKYDWRNAKGHALSIKVKDDPRRVLCYEFAAIATRKFLSCRKAASQVTANDLREAWKRSKAAPRPLCKKCQGYQCPNKRSNPCP